MIWPPDYQKQFADRVTRLRKLRAKPELWHIADAHYRLNPIDWIQDWCVTFDPRNAASGKPTTMPFVLFDRQKDLVRFLYECTNQQRDGLIEKCRDMGATWVACAFSVWLWRYWDGADVGWGSRKEELVDRLGVIDSIFEKMRVIIRNLPREMHPEGFNEKPHMPFMKIVNPANNTTIGGESGDNIGRGGRKMAFFKDESAHYERPERIEAALGDNTRCQIDISSVNGPGNVFHRRREAGIEWEPGRELAADRVNVFVMDWRHHPDKDQAWYDQRRAKAESEGLLHLFAQEVDRNYFAAVDGVIIPADWINSAIDAHVKLGFDDTGAWRAALDPADEGGDLHALAVAKGSIVKNVEAWGQGDTGKATRRAVETVSGTSVSLQYDAIGVGAGVKSEANRLRDEGHLPAGIKFVPWLASASPLDPDERLIPLDNESPVNRDFFKNLKAQAWWQLRMRFERTHKAINGGEVYDFSELISLPSDMPGLHSLRKELGQATRGKDGALRLIVNKTPDGTKSPNMADALVMAFWPSDREFGVMDFVE